MKIYSDLNIENMSERTITIGNFDGIHIGHKKLIEKTLSIAENSNQTAAVLTFATHTSNISKNKVKYICTKEQKIKLFEECNIDELFMIEFNEEIKSMKTEKFIKEILIDTLNVKNLVLGDDAVLGNDRLEIDEIKKICNIYDISAHSLDKIEISGQRVTSTLIRNMITNGILGEELSKFLGRTYYLEGKVIHGNNFGRELGFPTANISMDSSLLIPKYGVYYGICEIGNKEYKAGINIGNKPSVKNNYFGIEAFLIDFDENIYGYNIKINLQKYLREEIKFDSLEELKKQMNLDIEYIRRNYINK